LLIVTRGAGSGHTTWSSKAEQDDYLSFVGFMIYYMYHLCPPQLPFDAARLRQSDSDLHDLTPIQSRVVPAARAIDFTKPHEKSDQVPGSGTRVANLQPRLLLSGYSYGSLVTTLLPPIITSILPSFQSPPPESAHAEIRMRASRLAVQQNQLISEHMLAFHQSHFHGRGRSLHSEDVFSSPKGRKSSGGVRMGGDENLRRASHESHRSRGSFSIETPELVRKSLDRVRSIAKSTRSPPKRVNTQGSSVSASSHKSRGRTGSISSTDSPVEDAVKPEEVAPLQPVPGIGDDLQTAYLLISPLQGVVGGLATMWSGRPWRSTKSIPENEMKLVVDPSLAVFGDDDIFVGISKLRAWSHRLAEAGSGSESGDGNRSSRFEYVEVEGAGHFWHDQHTMQILREEVSRFTQSL
jgi:alpha/beta superfamily hydrolase